MLKLNPEQLYKQSFIDLYKIYLLLGNDPFLIQDSQDIILQSALIKGFKDHYVFQLDYTPDWQKIFSLCQDMNLFSKHQVIKIFLPENGPDLAISKNLITLANLMHRNLLVIIRGNKLTKSQEKADWFSKFDNISVLVSCQTPENKNLLCWLRARAKKNNLHIDEDACQFLCHCYEGNLLALSQTLNILMLLKPSNKLTLSLVKEIVNDNARFKPFHLVDALLLANIERALHILQQIRLEDSDPLILIRILQRELILLINLKRQSTRIPLHDLFNKYHVWQNRHDMITKVLNRLSQDQLNLAIKLLTRIEIMFKKDYRQSIWAELEALSLLICNKYMANIFFDG